MTVESSPERGMQRAPFGPRFVGALIDFGILGAAVFAYLVKFGTLNDEGDFTVYGCGPFLLLFGMWAFWLPIPEAIFGRTLGKWAAGLRVVDVSGRPISTGQAFGRHLLDPLDLACLGLVAFFVVRSTPLGQRVGDLAAHTRVIPVD